MRQNNSILVTHFKPAAGPIERLAEYIAKARNLVNVAFLPVMLPKGTATFMKMSAIYSTRIRVARPSYVEDERDALGKVIEEIGVVSEAGTIELRLGKSGTGHGLSDTVAAFIRDHLGHHTTKRVDVSGVLGDDLKNIVKLKLLQRDMMQEVALPGRRDRWDEQAVYAALNEAYDIREDDLDSLFGSGTRAQ